MHQYPAYSSEVGLFDERTRERNSRGVLGTNAV